jgi:hypothetical protein
VSFIAFVREFYGYYLGTAIGLIGGLGITWAYVEHQIPGGWMCVGPFLIVLGATLGAMVQRLREAWRP